MEEAAARPGAALDPSGHEIKRYNLPAQPGPFSSHPGLSVDTPAGTSKFCPPLPPTPPPDIYSVAVSA